MLKRKSLSVAVASALGVASAGMLTDAVYAADDETMIEEVYVTGSRIKRANVESASPVVVLDREMLENRGITDVGYLLQRMPSMAGSPIGTTTNNGGNGSVQIDLRGLGAIRTLTLVNGKRTIDGGDYQTIPATMIERVEILKDGASAVYGADAVAGVVNIITRTDYEGLKVEAYTSDFMDMDSGAQSSFNFISGKAFDGGNLVFGAEYVDQEEAYQSDAPWDFFQDSWYIYPGGCEAQLTAPYDGTSSGGCYVIGSSRIPESRLKSAGLNDTGLETDVESPNFGRSTFTNPTYMNDGSGLGLHDGRTYNYAPVNYIQTPYERTNVFANLNYEVYDGIQLTAEARFSSRTSAQELAPQPYNSPTDPSYAGTFQPMDPITGLALRTMDINYDADGDGALDLDSAGVLVDYAVYTGDQALGTVVPVQSYNGISPDNFYNPTGYAVTDARRRMVETTRRFTQDNDQIQLVFGLEGEFADLSWDVYFNKGWGDSTSLDFGQFYGPALANAMGPSADLDGDGTPECYADIADSSTLIKGCVPMNFFGGAGALTQEMIDYVAVDLVDTVEATQDQWGANLSGEAFELPAGSVGWAVGYEHREEFFDFIPDSGKQKDQVTGNTGAGTVGGYKSDSFFGEVLVPAFDNGTQSLTFTGGLRWDDFDNFGSESTFQIGGEFQVIETLKLRATAGDVFRAPSIGESFSGQVDSFPTYKDPCIPAAGSPLPPGCAQVGLQLDSQLLARVGGNPNLEAEFGDTLTAGLVWEPEFELGSLTVIVDYWKTDLENLISALGTNFILSDCYVEQNAGSCALITRRADYSIAQVLDAPLNVALSEAGGVDIDVSFRFDNQWGQWETAMLWSHTMTQDRASFAGDSVSDLVGTYTGADAYAEDKISYSVDWSRGDWRVAYLGEYISELESGDAFGVGYTQTVDSQLYHDVTAKYNHESGVSVSVGINNITDEEPPYIDLGFNAKTDPSTYRLFGRGYFLRLAWEMQD